MDLVIKRENQELISNQKSAEEIQVVTWAHLKIDAVSSVETRN